MTIIRTEIKSLTGMRGLAAVLVMIYHFSGHRLPDGPGYTVLKHGYMWVDLFFVLSGYVLALAHGGLVGKLTWPSYQAFLLRRIGRIYPLYIVVSLTALVIMLVTGGRSVSNIDHLTVTGTFANLFMVQAWGISGSLDGPAWSISTEWAASIIFPIIAFGALVLPPVVAVAMAPVAAIALLLLAYLPGLPRLAGPLDLSEGATFEPLLRCMAGFTLGVVACRASQCRRIGDALSHWWVGDCVMIVVIGLLTVTGTDAALALIFPLMVASQAAGTSFTSKLLSSKIPWVLGIISYSIYLTHLLSGRMGDRVVHLMESGGYGGLWMSVMVQVAIALPVACLTYFLIEKPGQGITRRMSRRIDGTSQKLSASTA